MTHPVLVLPIPSTPSDGDLALRALEGDSFGIELIFRRHAGYLLGLTTRLLANRTAAEAVVAATFVVAVRQLTALQPTASLRGWLARRAVVQTRRRLRRAWWFRWLRRDPQDDDAALSRLARLDLDLDERASFARVDDVLAHARPERRVAWMLSRVEGFELDDIAAACECSPATAWRRIADVDVLIDDPVSALSEAS